MDKTVTIFGTLSLSRKDGRKSKLVVFKGKVSTGSTQKL